MQSYSWVKLYIEVLDDPKMGRMTDDLWRRTIEMILLAGRTGNNGALPPLEDMAWTLRLSREQLEADLMKLEQMKVVRLENNTWHVINFSKRQSFIDVKDRVAQYRKRHQKQEYYEQETMTELDGNDIVTSRNTDKIRIDKNRSDQIREDNIPAKPDGLDELQRFVLTTFNAKRFANKTQAALVAAWDRYPEENVKAACKWAATKGFGLGQAISSIETALPKWGNSKPNGRSGQPTTMLDIIAEAQKDENYGKRS